MSDLDRDMAELALAVWAKRHPKPPEPKPAAWPVRTWPGKTFASLHSAEPEVGGPRSQHEIRYPAYAPVEVVQGQHSQHVMQWAPYDGDKSATVTCVAFGDGETIGWTLRLDSPLHLMPYRHLPVIPILTLRLEDER